MEQNNNVTPSQNNESVYKKIILKMLFRIILVVVEDFCASSAFKYEIPTLYAGIILGVAGVIIFWINFVKLVRFSIKNK